MAKKSSKLLSFVLYPFKIVFVLLSYIFKGMIIGTEKVILLFKNNNYNIKKKLKPSPKDYVPFRIIEAINGNFNKFESFISNNPSTIGLILGARGTGKSAIGLKILENLHVVSKKNFYAIGFKKEDMPEYVNVVENIMDIKPYSFVIIDEGGVLFSSRKSFSDANKILSELLLIARHNDLSILFISQNSANLEINVIRQADYLILKPSSLLQRDFERKKIKEIYDEVSDKFQKYKNIKGLTYIYSEHFKGFVSNPLPTFWNQNISKSFRKKI
ncbi:MAG: zonular occludens toxin domain-containing protein [Candidatus Woesearchaeota archaeon]